MTDSAVMPVLNIYVGPPQHPDLLSTGPTTTPSLQFSMVPLDVRRDVRLSHRDLRVYAELAGARRGRFVSLGERLLAKDCRIQRRAVRESIGKLVKCGHVVIEQAGHKRSRYRLTSPMFGRPEAAATEELPAKVVAAPVPLFCETCKRRVRGLGKTGVCRNCASVERTEKIADRVARKVVSEVSGVPPIVVPRT